VIPTARALRIVHDQLLGLVETLGAEREVAREAPKFAQEVVGADIVRPGTGHRLRHVGVVHGRQYAFDSTQIRDRIDPVGAQGIDQLSPILLHSSISGHARRTVKPGITVIESKRKEKNS
jgi:hypothetical protein